ncbi:MAG: SEC-C domain-containing protein [Chloroflexota bacterium]|nr:SEC-C domain-containing protein [Chloroflexota bacterium]
MEKNPMEWRSILDMIVRDAHPARIAANLPGMIEWGGGDAERGIGLLIGFSGNFMLESAGLAAAYVLPPEDPFTALATVADTLAHLDFETGLNELPKDQQRLVRRYIAQAKPAYADCGRVLQAVLGVYARGDYDLAADPNALILEAERAMLKHPETALTLLGRAGALGLRGKRWWWRWHKEIAQPLAGWIGLALNLIEDNSDPAEPLGPFEEERARWHAVTEAERESWQGAPLPEPPKPTAEERKLDELIERLYRGENALTKQLEKAIVARSEDAIPRLIEIVQDEDLAMEGARGEGWTPVHAVELLGTLRAGEAVGPLIDGLADADPLDALADAAIRALESIGAPAAPAALDTARFTRDRELKASIAAILGKVGHDHPATFDTLVALFNDLSWQEDRMFAAWGLGDLGDPRAVPILQNALGSRGISEQDQVEVEYALEQLGVRSETPRAVEPTITSAGKPEKRLRRTAQCWCGSGKQYRHCHMKKDAKKTRKKSRKKSP